MLACRRFFILSTCALAWITPLLAQGSSRFEAEIQRMLDREKSSPAPERGILFIGSSIFRLWANLSEQMAPLPVFNRAFGGSQTEDLLAQVDRLVLRYHPRIVVYYCGSNDINAGDSVETIVAQTRQFIRTVHEKAPGTMVFYTAIQKAPDKRDRWADVDAVNREMEKYSHQEKDLGFIDLNPALFDRQGNVREELFLPDQLHFRPESSAYAEFTAIVKPVLEKAWK